LKPLIVYVESPRVLALLGPAFFILYDDDLAGPFSRGPKFYADGLLIWFSSLVPLKAALIVQKTIDHLQNWFLSPSTWTPIINHQASHQP